MTLPLHPCPHCGALLVISPHTPDGERARCGACKGWVVWLGGRLVAATPCQSAWRQTWQYGEMCQALGIDLYAARAAGVDV